MFSVRLVTDYSSTYKEDMLQYLKNDVNRNKLNKDFISFLDKIDELEAKVTDLNDSYRALEKKYILLFSLRDFRNLFRDEKLKEEMLRYIEFKGNIEDEILPS